MGKGKQTEFSLIIVHDSSHVLNRSMIPSELTFLGDCRNCNKHFQRCRGGPPTYYCDECRNLDFIDYGDPRDMTRQEKDVDLQTDDREWIDYQIVNNPNVRVIGYVAASRSAFEASLRSWNRFCFECYSDNCYSYFSFS